MTSTLILTCVAAYLVGAVPFGYLAAKSKGIDIFQFGSGNPGATNVTRALGKGWGNAVFALDVLKGVLPALAARFVAPHQVGPLHAQAIWFLVGLFAVAGHCASPFLGFRGGKGIATSLGVGLAAAPVVALIAFGIFLVAFLVTRYISFSSIVAVCSTVVLGWFIPGQAPELIVVYVLLSVFVLYRHRGNIRRLREGTEPKFAFRKVTPSVPGLSGSDPSDSSEPSLTKDA